MEKDRRVRVRRSSDQILNETVRLLQILERISRGEDLDISEHYADLVGMREKLGRRQEDRKLGEALCSAIESISENLNRLLRKEGKLRQVRVTKMSGKRGAKMAVETTVLGWEEDRPRVGKNYRVFKEDGGVFRSAIVTKVTPGHFHTMNSVYRIEVLREK